MNILLTAVGKRVQLIKHLKSEFRVIGVDCSSLVAAANFLDAFYEVPRYNQQGYVDSLIDICDKEQVKAVIPLYETEFMLLVENRKRFEEHGIILILSDKRVIETFNDKWSTYNFFKSNQIPTPDTFTDEEILKKINSGDVMNYPYIIKPVDGMGSSNVFKINNEKELRFFIDYVEKPVVQSFAKGTEYTIDVFCDLNGKVVSAVPRIRLDVRAGEVAKTRTVCHRRIIAETISLCKRTKFVGPITIQCIVNIAEHRQENINFIEVNPRFGGGVPATFASGINYCNFIKCLVKGEPIDSVIGQFNEITMLRYDEAVIL
ncbi:ATP-grasp domain-containing protein [Clostridium oryzae]|uniref:Carbamoyl-phosphate synthase large chain n=1 Tax=Clostridium oryzae TaxID=1450648 RepID=A0A1V4IN15_9CLOT|nr:ATP-grasp domain-containing protein [Clostridium oryzae]OPJ60887.1 carbamoyl-phosphate synthase large chain [Clostridium oryzae]